MAVRTIPFTRKVLEIQGNKNYFFDSNVQTLKIAQRDNRFHNNPDYAAKIAAREEEIKSQAEYDNIKSDYWWCKKHSFSELQKENIRL